MSAWGERDRRRAVTHWPVQRSCGAEGNTCRCRQQPANALDLGHVLGAASEARADVTRRPIDEEDNRGGVALPQDFGELPPQRAWEVGGDTAAVRAEDRWVAGKVDGYAVQRAVAASRRQHGKARLGGKRRVIPVGRYPLDLGVT
jgi:hypothetical protein